MIRALVQQDLEAVKEVIGSTGLFPPDLLDEMTQAYFNDANSSDVWLVSIADNVPVAVAYCAPERLTEGTFNLYLIAVHKELHGKGVGTELISFVEDYLKTQGHRILIVETSGLPEFELTRRFYEKLQYSREAVIRDFYRAGEDKVIFWKMISAASEFYHDRGPGSSANQPALHAAPPAVHPTGRAGR